MRGQTLSRQREARRAWKLIGSSLEVPGKLTGSSLKLRGAQTQGSSQAHPSSPPSTRASHHHPSFSASSKPSFLTFFSHNLKSSPAVMYSDAFFHWQLRQPPIHQPRDCHHIHYPEACPSTTPIDCSSWHLKSIP
jgi:hypothetical protein